MKNISNYFSSKTSKPYYIFWFGIQTFYENFCSFAFCNSRKTFNDLSLTRTTCLLLFGLVQIKVKLKEARNHLSKSYGFDYLLLWLLLLKLECNF